MGKSHPVIFRELTFKSKADAKLYFKAIKDRYSNYELLVGKDFDDVEQLLDNHPRSATKVGLGIEAIGVAPDRKYGRKCFWLVQKDGPVEEFSYKKCIDGDMMPFAQFSAACRRVVDSDMVAFRRQYFDDNRDHEGKVKCSLSGVPISWDESVTDHEGPQYFSSIVFNFINERGIDIKMVAYNRDGWSGVELVDSAIVDDFRSYHASTAKIRVISRLKNEQMAHLARMSPEVVKLRSGVTGC